MLFISGRKIISEHNIHMLKNVLFYIVSELLEYFKITQSTIYNITQSTNHFKQIA